MLWPVVVFLQSVCLSWLVQALLTIFTFCWVLLVSFFAVSKKKCWHEKMFCLNWGKRLMANWCLLAAVSAFISGRGRLSNIPGPNWLFSHCCLTCVPPWQRGSAELLGSAQCPPVAPAELGLSVGWFSLFPEAFSSGRGKKMSKTMPSFSKKSSLFLTNCSVKDIWTCQTVFDLKYWITFFFQEA